MYECDRVSQVGSVSEGGPERYNDTCRIVGGLGNEGAIDLIDYKSWFELISGLVALKYCTIALLECCPRRHSSSYSNMERCELYEHNSVWAKGWDGILWRVQAVWRVDFGTNF